MIRRRQRQDGFTLIELLVVLGILVGFLAMLVQFVDSGVRLFDEGEAGQALADRAEAARVAVERELRAIRADATALDRGVPPDRFLVQRPGLGLPPRTTAKDARAFLLRAGVSLPKPVEQRMIEDQLLVEAAAELGPTAEPAAIAAHAQQRRNSRGLRGTGRILLGLWPESVDGALLELRIGRFLADQLLLLGDGAAGEVEAVDPFLVAEPGGSELPSVVVYANTEPLVRGLLFADVQLWSQSTTSWDGAGRGGPEAVWDSARGGWLSDPAQGPVFGYDLYPESLEDPTDDIHPRALRLTLVVAQDEARPKEGLLADPVDAGATVVRLLRGDRFPGPEDGGFAKIEGEWIRYAERVGDELRGCRRGQRGTPAVPHGGGAVVRVGRTVLLSIPFPHGKDDWNG